MRNRHGLLVQSAKCWESRIESTIDESGVSFPGPELLTFHQIRHQLINNILHCAVKADVLQRMGLMDDILAGWTGVILLQVFHQAAFTN